MRLYIKPIKWLALAAILLLSIQMDAQSTGRAARKPVSTWIQMMDDTAANYYAAKEDYEKFWKGREKPEDEEHLMSTGTEKTKEHIKKLSKKEMREEREMDYYRYQCKRFENWLLINKPYVQKDGRLLTTDERLKLWEAKQKSKQ